VYSAGDTTVYLFTEATSYSVPRPHPFVYFCVMTQQNVNGSDQRNASFSWAYSAQTVHQSPKLNHERHILGMSTSPRNDSHCRKLCRLSYTHITFTNTPSEVPILSCFGTCKTPTQKFRNFSTVYACAHRVMSFIFKMLKIGAV